MGNFKTQIEEDIQEYQLLFPYMEHIGKDEWAFNYWVLDKLFHEEEDIIETKIVDYNDLGIDAFEIYEDTHDIYLIQNKYYNENSSITREYVENDFLLRAIGALENGTYRKSEELQNAFTKMKDTYDDFSVYLQLFVTNNKRNQAADEYTKKFNQAHPQYHAKIFYLDDIEEKYYGEAKVSEKVLTVNIASINKGTILSINSDAYKLENNTDARYVFAPIVSVFKIYRDALEKQYPIFDKNIREYLGNKGINKHIYTTLLDSEERKNFFYYNNGITIICDKIKPIKTQNSGINSNALFEIDNPQIVNGCQTVNSIYEALSNISVDKLEDEFKDTFVMLKILEINRADDKEHSLYEKIVKYNNSQNAIDEKAFTANVNDFLRLQTEFRKKGFLLLVKQSDKNKFSKEYKTVTALKATNSERIERFDLAPLKKASDVFIPLDKFLQVIIAYCSGGFVAFTKKSSVLKFGTTQYKTAIEFIRDDRTTIDSLLDLYLLHMKAEQNKRKSKDKRIPIPYYVIDGFAKYDCKDRNPLLIKENLSNKEKISRILKIYTVVSSLYTSQYCSKNNIDYNKMIKQKVDYDLFKSTRDSALALSD